MLVDDGVEGLEFESGEVELGFEVTTNVSHLAKVINRVGSFILIEFVL